MTLYRLCWKYKEKEGNVHHGQWFKDKNIVEAWAEDSNKNYPLIFHYVETKEEDNSHD